MKKLDFEQMMSHFGLGLENDLQVTDFQVDSRKVKEGSLFFALPGDRTDGHQFLKKVAQKGAVGAVVAKSYQGESFGMSLRFVEDVLVFLQNLAKEFLQKAQSRVIAITGSVGKTTTKEFTFTLLQDKFYVGKSPANYNTQIGLPLSILNAKGDEKILVLEMGMTHFGQIKKLIEIAPPEIAVLTKVDLMHSENFPDGIKGIEKAKAEIFLSEQTKVRIVEDDLKDLVKGSKVTFSMKNPTADYYLKKIQDKYYLDERGVRAACIDFPFEELHFIEDALIAMTIARQCKMHWDDILKQIPKLTPPKMRFEKIYYNGTLLINDAYNAGPESIRSAIESLPLAERGRKVIGVFGEMSHLGDFSEEGHRKIGHWALEKMDEVLCIGERCAPICEIFHQAKKSATLYKSLSGLTKKLKELMMPGDVVLIKGSRHLNLDQIFQKLD